MFRCGRPWCLLKYPSDGSEHKVGDIEFTEQDRTNYNTLKGPFLKSLNGQIYGANGMSPALNWLCEIYDIDRTAAERILDRKNMKQLKRSSGTSRLIVNSILKSRQSSSKSRKKWRKCIMTTSSRKLATTATPNTSRPATGSASSRNTQ